MKKCLVCGEVKDFLDFTKRSKSKDDKYQSYCKKCIAFEQKIYKRFISTLVKRWKMKKGCSLCNFKAEHSCQLDIDHIIPKRFPKANRQAINTSWSKKRLKEELSKCQVLCANCHRLKTYKDGTMFQMKKDA